jgi:NitT/TauT family transport system substrate-binding protein
MGLDGAAVLVVGVVVKEKTVLFVVAAFLLGACGTTNEGSDTTGAPAVTSTVVAETSTSSASGDDSDTTVAPGDEAGEMDRLDVIILPYITYAPYYIAIEEGYFEEQGIEVEVVNMTNTEEVMPALSSGQVDVASGLISSGMLNAIARGADVRITADKGYIDPDGCVNFSVIGRSDLVESGQLETADQLAGKTVNVVPATWLEYFFETVLETGGIGLDDVNTVNIGSPSTIDGLASDQLDAVVNSEPWLTILKSNGHGEVLPPAQELTPNESVAVQIYGPNLLNDNRELGVRFMAAYLRAVEQYAEGPTERNLDIVAGFTELDRGLLENMCWPGINPSGEVLVDGVLAFEDFALERGYLDEIVPADDFYDGSFIEDARSLLTESG